MEGFNNRAYDAWRTHHWTDEAEPDLPEINDPRVVNVWEEAEDGCDEHPLPRYARVRVKFKPWKDDDYTEVLSYYDYIDETKKYRTKITEEVNKAYYIKTLSEMMRHMSAIKECMEEEQRHLSAMEKPVCERNIAEYERRIFLVKNYIRKAKLHVEILEDYIFIARRSFPWIEPIISDDFEELKKKFKKEEETVLGIVRKIESDIETVRA